MKTRSLAILPLALAAIAPAAADAAVASGTYRAEALVRAGEEVAGTSFGVTVDGGKVTGLTVKWLCNVEAEDPTEIDRETVVVVSAADKAVFPVKKNRLKWSGTARTLSGDLFSDPPNFQEGKAKVKIAGTWKGSTLTGTFQASMGGCVSGPLSYTAKRA